MRRVSFFIVVLCMAWLNALAQPAAEPAKAPATPAAAPPAAPTNPADRYGFKTRAALDAVNAFVISERKLHEAYATGVSAARDRMLGELEILRKNLDRDNNLEESARIGAAIEAIKAGDLPTQELALGPAPSIDKKPTSDAAVQRTKRALYETRWTGAYAPNPHASAHDKVADLDRALQAFDMTLHADGSLTLVEYDHESLGTWTVSPDKPEQVRLKWKPVSSHSGGEVEHIYVVAEVDRAPVLLDIQGKLAHTFIPGK